MEPQIHYCTTSDGASIAYWAIGSGPPLVYLTSAPFTNIEGEWKQPQFRRAFEMLARYRTVIRYDGRGSGMSERDAHDFSLDARLRDLNAVVKRLDLEPFALSALAASGPTAIAYAARHPERVTHLMLYASYARSMDYLGLSQVQGLFALLQTDWQLFTETVAHVIYGWSEAEGRAYAEFLRGAVSPQVTRAFFEAQAGIDVSDLLPKISAPTLVIHRRDFGFPSIEIARELAAHIPNAQLTTFDFEAEEEVVLPRVMREFLGHPPADEDAADASHGAISTAMVHPGLATILFTDIEASTELTQRLGDLRARELMREHELITRKALAEHGGSVIKSMGDGFMASFLSATGALECAIAMQRAFRRQNAAYGTAVNVRIGLNAGEPIAEGDDLFGTAVTVAARIMQHASGGEIVVTDVVRQLVAGKDFLFADRGEVELRGFDDPVRLWELRSGE